MNILEEIVARRRAEVARVRAASDPHKVARAAEQMRAGKNPHALRHALENDARINLLGEFKRGSPSLGLVRGDANPREFAHAYEQAGVCAISVLTEPDYFYGSLEDLRVVHAATTLPILRKDFVVDRFQIDEAAAAGADAILLIVATLSQAELTSLRQRAENELGLDALVEIHAQSELERAVSCGAKLIGVNNRDLRDFRTSIETSLELARFAPNDALLVSESGISHPSQIARLRECGYRGFLIGEALMRADNPGEVIRNLSSPFATAPHV